MEKQRRRRRLERSQAPELHESTSSPQAPGTGGGVQVIWGADAQTYDLAEMTVGEVYGMLQAPLNIAPAVAALVNGNATDAGHQLAVGDVLEFARPAGEKGAGA